MKNYLYYLRATEDQAATFNDWLLDDLGPRIAASDDCSGLRVNIGVPAPSKKPLYANEPREGDGFDASLDLACPDEATFARLSSTLLIELATKTEACFGYDVDLLIEKDNAAALQGNPAPGYKIMRGFYFFDDLSPEAARRCWDNHVNAALRLHGFERYVRYWVNKPVTEGAPAIGGATNLHFGSAEDVLDRYFTVPDGMTQIQQDIGHFIKSGLARLFTREHILK